MCLVTLLISTLVTCKTKNHMENVYFNVRLSKKRFLCIRIQVIDIEPEYFNVTLAARDDKAYKAHKAAEQHF